MERYTPITHKEKSPIRLTTRGKRAIAGTALAGAAAAGFALPTSNSEPMQDQRMLAVCEGVQTYTAQPGDTLTSLVADKIRTNPDDNLKTPEGLTTIAQAISSTAEVSADSVLLVPYQYGNQEADGLTAGQQVTLPESCERIS